MADNVANLALLQLRSGLGLRQTELADLLGLSRSTYNKIEKGRRDLHLSEFARLVDATNLQAQDALTLLRILAGLPTEATEATPTDAADPRQAPLPITPPRSAA